MNRIVYVALLGMPLLAFSRYSLESAHPRAAASGAIASGITNDCTLESAVTARENGASPAGILAAPRPADGTTRFRILRRARPDSAFEPMGVMTVEQRTVSVGAGVVLRVITYDYGSRGGVVDTTLSFERTLAPICERTRKSSGADIVMDFTGATVAGYMGVTDGRRTIADTLPTPAFNTTDLDLVVRSLPLSNGYRASLPVYDPEFGGYRDAEVSAAIADSMASATSPREGRVWRVVARDWRHETTYLIDDHTRAILDLEVRSLQDGVMFRIVPSSPRHDPQEPDQLRVPSGDSATFASQARYGRMMLARPDGRVTN